jgi:hypothetical protein
MAIDELAPGSSHERQCAALFARKCDVDRAEACLIALAGLKRAARNE